MAHDPHNVKPIEGSFAPRPAAGLVSADIDGELLLLDPRTDRLYQLDRVGSMIWSVLDGEATVDELVDDLADVFATPADAVRHDLGELLLALRGAGALDGDDPPEHLLHGHDGSHGGDHDGGSGSDVSADGVWRPVYLVDPPAP